MNAQAPGGGTAEEQETQKPKVQPANWHPTGVGEIGDGPGPIAPQPADDLVGTTASPVSDGKDDVIVQPDNWHPTTEPTNP